MKTTLFIILCLGIGLNHLAFASEPPIDSCYNDPDPTICGFTSNPFSATMDYFDQIMPGFGTLLLWGPIIFGLWYKTQQPLIAGFAGIILVGTVTSLHPQGVAIGLLLMAMSLGIAFIDIFRRLKQTA